MKKTAWIVKAYTGYKTGWQEIKRFNNPADADLWLCSYIRENGYSPADFTIVASETSDAFSTIRFATRRPPISNTFT